MKMKARYELTKLQRLEKNVFVQVVEQSLLRQTINKHFVNQEVERNAKINTGIL